MAQNQPLTAPAEHMDAVTADDQRGSSFGGSEDFTNDPTQSSTPPTMSDRQDEETTETDDDELDGTDDEEADESEEGMDDADLDMDDDENADENPDEPATHNPNESM